MVKRPDIIHWDGDLATLADAVRTYKDELLKKGLPYVEAMQLVREFQSSIIVGASVSDDEPTEPWEE